MSKEIGYVNAELGPALGPMGCSAVARTKGLSAPFRPHISDQVLVPAQHCGSAAVLKEDPEEDLEAGRVEPGSVY